MKITTFNPLIVTKDADAIVQLFEELGFERRHNIEASTGRTDFNSIRMKDANGFYVDVANIGDMQQDLSLIRINVDDFEEAYDFFISKGFVNASGNIVSTETNKSAMLRSPSGFAIDLCHHIKRS